MFMEATANNYFTYKYPTGFALSGGFIKGFAHLGVMQALLEHGIRPDVLSGVSAGALAGVFYADGNEPHDVLRFFAGHTFQDLTKLVIPKVGLFELDEFIDFLRTNLKATSTRVTLPSAWPPRAACRCSLHLSASTAPTTWTVAC